MTQDISGGCKCGAVRYQGAPIAAPMFRCHCRDCQQLTGSGHAEMLPLDQRSFVVSGKMKTYEMQGGSGQPTYSGFCPECGAQLTRRSARMADRIYVHAGSLDEPDRYRPQKSIYAEAAQPWDRSSVIEPE